MKLLVVATIITYHRATIELSVRVSLFMAGLLSLAPKNFWTGPDADTTITIIELNVSPHRLPFSFSSVQNERPHIIIIIIIPFGRTIPIYSSNGGAQKRDLLEAQY